MTWKNVILVSYDSVRSDVAYSGKFPGIERLRKNGVTFRNCVSSAPVTPISHSTLMTGLQPYNHGVRHLFKEQLDRSCDTMAALLKREGGFATSGVVSCPGLNAWYDIGRGFDQWDDEIPLLPDGTDPLETVDVKLRGQALKCADLVIERSLAQLETLSQSDRFCHFMHFFDAHWPYEPPSEPYDVEVANAYEGEVAFMDHYFAEWFQQASERGYLEDTLIVLISDHGEDLEGWYPNDRGGEANGHPEEAGHGCLLYDQTQMVALVFWSLDMQKREIETQVRLVDVAPTILEMLGMPALDRSDGRSLAVAVQHGASLTSVPAYSETFYSREQNEASDGKFEWTRDKKSIRIDNKYKVIMHVGDDAMEVYDLERDPLERTNLAASSDDN
ncbi:MAG: sulfatase [Litoreibacter sp.]|nr:sulfatase [Litoreibacter sp.]